VESSLGDFGSPRPADPSESLLVGRVIQMPPMMMRVMIMPNATRNVFMG